jgi:hypothetical protein
LLYAWLGEFDASSINSLDSYVEDAGRRYVRHYVLDFGTTLGSATREPKGLHRSSEYLIEVGRTLRALVSLGLYHRPFQDNRSRWREAVERYPAAGWFPAEDFDPDEFRTNRKVPSHARRTDRDLYWGAKLVTSFSDDQIAAVLATARLPEADAAYLDHALRVRRDIIGRRYLRAFAAIENPELDSNGTAVCFDDLAIARGYGGPGPTRYRVEVTDGDRTSLSVAEQVATGSRSCVALGPAERDPRYRIVSISARYGDAGQASAASKATRIHLRWRAAEQRFKVVGIDRDDWSGP